MANIDFAMFSIHFLKDKNLLGFIKNINICVSKMNKRHKGADRFWGELPLQVETQQRVSCKISDFHEHFNLVINRSHHWQRVSFTEHKTITETRVTSNIIPPIAVISPKM